MGENRTSKDQFQLRLPDGLRESIRLAALDNGRSMNAEIVARVSVDAESLRDKFAGQAAAAIIGGLVTAGASTSDEDAARITDSAYKLADALLAARKAGGE